jgi:transposase
MSMVGGFDIHRKQITFDYVDTVTGDVRCGQIVPADRQHLAAWLSQRFAGRDDVAFAVEACTGWRYVAEELARAGVVVSLAEPADTAAARGPKRRAKTDRADARLLRELLEADRVPTCWIPPEQVLEYRALLELYHDLRRAHTAWIQRIHAVCFHQGAEQLRSGLSTEEGRAQLRRIAAEQLSPAGQAQVTTNLDLAGGLEVQLDTMRRRLLHQAKHLRGAKALAEQVYGVGPITGLALTCWLGGAARFTSSRQAVRFTGLDVTVYSSAGKRSPGHLSRQGPPVLRWCVYEAGKTHARASAPDHAYYAKVKDRNDGKRAALAEARKIVRVAMHILTDLGDDAFATV